MPNGTNNSVRNSFSFRDCSNIIMRYIRVRSSYSTSNTEIDTLYAYEVSNYIFDHVSVSWGSDEIFDMGNGFNYTIQKSLFGDALKTGALLGAEPQDSGDYSFLRNMFYNCSHRLPNVGGSGRVDNINNIGWNFRSRIAVQYWAYEANDIGNYYEYFGSNPGNERLISIYPFNIQNSNSSPALFPTIYTSGNYVTDVLTDPNEDNWKIYRWRFDPYYAPYGGSPANSQLTTDFQTNTPFPLLGEPIPILSYADALNTIPYDVGVNARLDENGVKIEELDAIDTIFTTNVQNQTLVQYTQESNATTSYRTAFINSISTTPINTHPSNYYSSLDGIPNSWKQLKGLDLNTDYTTFAWPKWICWY